jgi:sugar-specific transcriptional regulator TrmB
MEIQNKSLVQRLTKSGFTDKEALVYVSVLELKGAFPSRIAEYSGIRRSTVYNILVALSIRGIVNEIEKKNKIFYQVEQPEKILRHANTKLQTAKDTINNLNQIIPEINNIYNTGSDSPKITYYTGKDGIFSIYEDMVSVTKPYEMLAFTNAKEFVKFVSKSVSSNYFKAKEKVGITTRAILPDTEEDRQARETAYKDIDRKYWPIFKHVDKSTFPSATEITIYAPNKVSIINFKENHLAGVVIEDSAIHGMMRAIFELAWDSKKVRE